MTRAIRRPTVAPALVARLVDAPDLVRGIRELPAEAFSALVRHVGIEDAGELVALATTEQIVAAFDEDLFTSNRPGERETFDAARFVTWLEVLLEAGDAAAAARVAELGEDFLANALAALVFVLDQDALRERMDEDDDDARLADKAIEASLSEELDGYLLLARVHDGWDAVLSLVLALDRDQRDFLVRVLDRCVAIGREYAEDLDALATALGEAESLAEDVEAEREERRAKRGYVEPRAARSFLALARKPMGGTARDAVTKAYFRDLEPAAAPQAIGDGAAKIMRWLAEAEATRGAPRRRALPVATEGGPFGEAMRAVAGSAPSTYAERLEELAYLTNVVVAGATSEHGRFRPADAATAVLSTVAFGAELVARERRKGAAPATAEDLADVLRDLPADVLFRRASASLADGATALPGLVRNARELEVVLRAPVRRRS